MYLLILLFVIVMAWYIFESPLDGFIGNPRSASRGQVPPKRPAPPNPPIVFKSFLSEKPLTERQKEEIKAYWKKKCQGSWL
jgi:hypothetical protein